MQSAINDCDAALMLSPRNVDALRLRAIFKRDFRDFKVVLHPLCSFEL